MSGHVDNADVIARDANRWLLGAGAAAVLLSLFLAVTDYRLSHSKREEILGNTLREMRTAQASMHSRVTDTRQTQDAVYGASNGASSRP